MTDQSFVLGPLAKHGFCDALTRDHSALHHPGTNSCIVHEITTWSSVVRWIMPVYLALHTIPPLVLRRKSTLKE